LPQKIKALSPYLPELPIYRPTYIYIYISLSIYFIFTSVVLNLVWFTHR